MTKVLINSSLLMTTPTVMKVYILFKRERAHKMFVGRSMFAPTPRLTMEKAATLWPHAERRDNQLLLKTNHQLQHENVTVGDTSVSAY